MNTPHNGTLDYAKLIAAFGIVWFHTSATGASYGYAGLAFFLILLVLMAPSGVARQSFGAYTRSRATRLLVPWLVWCAIYGAFKLAEIVTTSATLDTEFNATMWVTGTAIHLWFLPFAFVLGLVLYPLLHSVKPRPHLALSAVFGITALIGLAGQSPLPTPLAEWAYAMPPVCIALCILYSGGGHIRQLAIIGAAGVIGLSAGWTMTPQIIIAGLALVLCTALPLPATPLSAKAARLSLTVYLLHPLIAALLMRAVDMPSNSVAFAGLTIILTTALAFAFDTAKHMSKPQMRGYLPQA